MITGTPDNRSQQWGRVLPGIAIVFSAFALVTNSDLSNISSLIVSMVGVTAGVLFFKGNNVYRPLLLVWIYAQFPAISMNAPAGVQPLLDAGQFLTLKVGITLSGIVYRVNLVPFAFLALYRFLLMASLVGKRVSISSFRKDSAFGDALPVEGIIARSFDLGNDKNWVMVALDKDLMNGGKNYRHVLLKSKEGELMKPGKKVVSHLRLVADDSAQEKFPFVDWAFVQVLK